MEIYETLEKAMALIEDEENWSSRGWGSKGKRCAVHALASALGDPAVARRKAPVYLALRTALGSRCLGNVGEFNDACSHAEVLDVFRRAIAAEKLKAATYVELPRETARV